MWAAWRPEGRSGTAARAGLSTVTCCVRAEVSVVRTRCDIDRTLWKVKNDAYPTKKSQYLRTIPDQRPCTGLARG